MSFAETFKALSDPARRKILELLKNGRLSAGEIAGHFDMTQATGFDPRDAGKEFYLL